MEKVQQEMVKTLEIIAEANKLVSEGRYNDSKELLEKEIAKIEDSKEFQIGNCYDISEPIEQILFIIRNPEKSSFTKTTIPVASLYTTYGKLLMGLGKLEEASESFSKAIEYNPVNPRIRMEFADIYRAKYNNEQFIELTIENFKNAYSSEVLGELYRNLGYCYIEKEMWKEAMGCYLMSLHYDAQNSDAEKEIKYIQEKTAGEAGVPSIDEFREMATDLGIPVGPNEEIVGIAASYAHKAQADGREDVAHYFFKIVYDLTDDEEIFETLQKIEEKIATEK